METKVNYTLVGGFVLFLAVATVSAILWVAEIGGRTNADYYTVYFVHHSLSGLQKDSYVLMKGIRVGSVDQYQIAPDNIEAVKVTLLLESGTPVKVSTRAVISRNLLTGLATIELVGSTRESPKLEKSSADEKYPVIPEGKSALDKITDSVPALVKQVGELANRVQVLLNDENISAVSNSLKNVEQVTLGLVENRKLFESTLKSFEAVTRDISKISSDAATFTKNTDQRFGELTKDSRATLQQLQETIKNLDAQIKAVAGSMTSSSQVFSHEMVTIAQSISDAADAFAKTIEEFEDPRRIISGPRKESLGPGEVLKK